MIILPVGSHKVLLIFIFKALSWKVHFLANYTTLLDLGSFGWPRYWWKKLHETETVGTFTSLHGERFPNFKLVFLLCPLDVTSCLRAQCRCELLKIKLIEWSSGKIDYRLQRSFSPEPKLRGSLGHMAKRSKVIPEIESSTLEHVDIW